MSRSTEIGCAAFRISRLLADGTPDYGNASGSFAVCGGITKFTPDFEVEKGDEIFIKDSIGAPCVNVVRDDIDKWVTFELELCKDDYRIWEILGLGDALSTAGSVTGLGHTMAAGCAVTARDRVCIELWVQQYDCDAAVVGFPYKRHVLTKAVLTPKGADISEKPTLPVFSGKGFNNANIADGPWGDLDTFVTNSFVGAYAKVDDTALPYCPSPQQYLQTPASAS